MASAWIAEHIQRPAELDCWLSWTLRFRRVQLGLNVKNRFFIRSFINRKARWLNSFEEKLPKVKISLLGKDDFLWLLYGLLWFSYDFLWFPYDFRMISVWFSYDLCMIFLWFFVWGSYVFLYDFPMFCVWFSYVFCMIMPIIGLLWVCLL